MGTYFPGWFKNLLKTVFTIVAYVLALIIIILIFYLLLSSLPDLFG